MTRIKCGHQRLSRWRKHLNGEEEEEEEERKKGYRGVPWQNKASHPAT